MKKNVGLIDAIVRFVLAVIVAVLIFRGDLSGTLAIVTGIAAAALLITGLVGWCGLYALLGIRTCPKK
jgi:hypothetical protein